MQHCDGLATAQQALEDLHAYQHMPAIVPVSHPVRLDHLDPVPSATGCRGARYLECTGVKAARRDPAPWTANLEKCSGALCMHACVACSLLASSKTSAARATHSPRWRTHAAGRMVRHGSGSSHGAQRASACLGNVNALHRPHIHDLLQHLATVTFRAIPDIYIRRRFSRHKQTS